MCPSAGIIWGDCEGAKRPKERGEGRELFDLCIGHRTTSCILFVYTFFCKESSSVGKKRPIKLEELADSEIIFKAIVS